MGIPIKPVWGDVAPSAVAGYKVVVCPKTYAETCWDFLVLIPAGNEEPEDLALVTQMCEAALKVGETFCVYRLSHGEEEEYRMMPVMWFRGDDEEPSWMTPPVSMFN